MIRNVKSENTAIKRTLLAAAMLVVSTGAAAVSHAGMVTIAGFDYGQSVSPVQSGFTKVDNTAANVTTTTGDGIGIRVDTAASGSRDRGEVTGNPLSDLIRDLHFISSSSPVTFTLSGLAPNTTYNIAAYAYDREPGNNGKILAWTTNGGTVTHTTNSSDPSSAAFDLKPLTTDGSGQGTITGDHIGGLGGSVILWNGFEILSELPAGTTVLLR